MGSGIALSHHIDNAYNEVEKIFEYGNSFEFPHTDSELIEINDTKLYYLNLLLSPLKYTGPRAYIQYYNQNLFLIKWKWRFILYK